MNPKFRWHYISVWSIVTQLLYFSLPELASFSFSRHVNVFFYFDPHCESICHRGFPRTNLSLEGVECHIYLYCFTFVYISLNRAFVIIVLFPKITAVRKRVQMV